MSDIKGLCFDKDGTLFDFGATWVAWAMAFLLRLSDDDRDRARALGRAIGFDLDNRSFARDSIVIAGTPAQVTEALLSYVPQWSAPALTEMLNEEAEKAPQQEAVPLMPLLENFRRRGLALGVATNDAEAPARVHLRAAGVLGMFDFIAGFDSGHGGKPTPGQLLAFAAAVQLEPHQIVMVGDSTHDLSAGRAAGMATVAVLTGLAQEPELRPLADVVLPDIGHLPGWLDQRS